MPSIHKTTRCRLLILTSTAPQLAKRLEVAKCLRDWWLPWWDQQFWTAESAVPRHHHSVVHRKVNNKEEVGGRGRGTKGSVEILLNCLCCNQHRHTHHTLDMQGYIIAMTTFLLMDSFITTLPLFKKLGSKSNSKIKIYMAWEHDC